MNVNDGTVPCPTCGSGMYVSVTKEAHRANAAEAERDKLRAENERLRAALKKVIHAHGGSHCEDCNAEHCSDEDVDPDGESPDPWCDCGALKIRNDARALLAELSESATPEKP